MNWCVCQTRRAWQWEMLFVVVSCTCPGLEALGWQSVSVLSMPLVSCSPEVNACSVSVSIARPASFCTTHELLLAPVALVRASPCLIETLIHTPVFPGLIMLVVPSLHSFSCCAQRRLSSFRLAASVLIAPPLLRASFASSTLRLD